MQEPKSPLQESTEEVGSYEAPRVETVVTSDEVEREAHYGGLISMN